MQQRHPLQDTLDTYDVANKDTGNKIVWEEQVRVSEEYTRRVAIEEQVVGSGALYRVVVATCEVLGSCPKWTPRSDWKSTYEEAFAMGKNVLEWISRYAREHGYEPAQDVVSQ
jgi:hypothetical protein